MLAHLTFGKKGFNAPEALCSQIIFCKNYKKDKTWLKLNQMKYQQYCVSS